MKRYILALLMLFLSASFIQASEKKKIHGNGLEFWTETFGKKEDPAILLIMGSGGEGRGWPTKFCTQLADEGFFVIRYDHGDIGQSSPIDFEKTPYNLLDMAKDAAGILDSYGIKKANVVGVSMGGYLAMLDAIDGKPPRCPLSAPNPLLLTWLNGYKTHPPQTAAENEKKLLELKRIQNRAKAPLDEESDGKVVVAEKPLPRTQGILNHLTATSASYELLKQSTSRIKVPTLIIQGGQDPVFQRDHGKALKEAILGAQLDVIEDMGHGLNSHFYDHIIKKIVELVKAGK